MNKVNGGLELLCAAMMLFLILGILIDKNGRTHKKIFCSMLVCQLILLIFDSIASLSNRVVSNWGFFVTNTCCFIGFFCTFVLLVLFSFYLFSYLQKGKSINKYFYLAIIIVGAIGIILLVVNVFNGMYYYYDSDNIYRHGPLYLLCQAFGFVIIAINIVAITVYRKNLNKRQIFTFLLFDLFPIVGLVLKIVIESITFSYIIPSFGLLVVYINIYLENVREKDVEIEKQKQKMLISQIQPHFIFNTLATIKYLVMTDSEQAVQALDDFSSYLRGNINSLSNDELIPFSQELKHTECYLNIEKIRFQNRLNVIYNIKDSDFLIPSLVIEAMVENAVRHGISKKQKGGTLYIGTYSDNQRNYVEIKDDGVGFSVDEKFNDTHVGLSNTRNRIKNAGGRFSIKSSVSEGTEIEISFPKKNK